MSTSRRAWSLWPGSAGARSRPDELEEALSTARAEQTNRTDDYLLGMPLLPDYLEEGLDRLGYSVEDAEDELL